VLSLVAVTMIAGGVGDLLLQKPPRRGTPLLSSPFRAYRQAPRAYCSRSCTTLGGALAACGLAVLALVCGPLRRGERWAGPVVAAVVLLSDGLNAFTLASLELSYFWGPLAFASLVLLGLNGGVVTDLRGRLPSTGSSQKRSRCQLLVRPGREWPSCIRGVPAHGLAAGAVRIGRGSWARGVPAR
jgi:uncharacterized membrane protein YhhN